MSDRTRQLAFGLAIAGVLAAVGLGFAWTLTRPLVVPLAGTPEWLEWQRARFMEISAADDPSPAGRAVSECIFDTMLDDNGELGIKLMMRAMEAQHAGAEHAPLGTHMIAAPLLDVSVHCAKQQRV